MGKTLYITTLGRFSMRYPTYDGPGMISNQDNASWRLWAFLQYLCTFHDRAVAREEIIDVLWNDVDIADPVNSIKTVLHRSRLMLEKLGFEDGKQVLLYHRGVYSWNPELTIWTDIEEFDALCARFYGAGAADERLKAAHKALTLYQGDFLPDAAGSPWALSSRTYYHAKYLRLCIDVSNELWRVGRVDEAIDICRTATELDPYDEPCQLLMMRLLCALGEEHMATQYYNDVSNLLMTQLGVMPSEELTALYHELIKSQQQPELDLQTVRAELMEKERESGAFFCEYSVFQDIYSLIVRSAIRSGQVVQLSVITLLDRDGAPLPGERRAAAMEELRGAIMGNLRSGDVFTQLSAVQYLLMLPAASLENGLMAIERVLSAYRQTVTGVSTMSKCSLLSALSVEQQGVFSSPGGFRELRQKER